MTTVLTRHAPLYGMRAIAVLVLVVLVFSGVTVGASLPNGSEPGFTKNIGPQDQRADNPFAAGLVAVAVAGVILYGLHRHKVNTAE